MVELKTNLQSLIENRDWKTLKQTLNEFDAIQIAQLIEDTSKDEEIIIFRLLNRQQSKEVFQLLSHFKQEQVINGLATSLPRLSNLLNDLEPDDRTAFFEELPGKVIQRLLPHLSPEERDITIQLLGYPKDSIGRIMTPEYVAVKPQDTIEHAFNHIRKYGRDSETLNFIYVVNSDWKLIDDIRIKEIILASPSQKIEDITDKHFVALNVMDDQETALKMFKDYDRAALPVINQEGVLLGIVTFDDIMDIAEEETSEDFYKFGSFQQAIINPVRERILQLYKKRIVWLITLVFVNVFSGAAIATYEEVIQSVVALVFFLPLLIGSGGNAGSQAATLMIRALVLREVQPKDWLKLLGREFIVSFLLGITMAAGVALVAGLRTPEIMAVVSATMVLVVMTGSLVGLLLPFIFTKLKIDPATASGPLVTSITDIGGVTIYFSIASWYFGL